tara:strand:- start:65 stop:385 length:321 start_codon:yes stop_codon:yes gene_type:complete
MKARSWIKAYLANHPCVDCGEDDIRVLEFDHIDPSQKEFNISRGVADGRGLKSIKSEIEKCEVRCCNCHRIRTIKNVHYLPEGRISGGQMGDTQDDAQEPPSRAAN